MTSETRCQHDGGWFTSKMSILIWKGKIWFMGPRGRISSTTHIKCNTAGCEAYRVMRITRDARGRHVTTIPKRIYVPKGVQP